MASDFELLSEKIQQLAELTEQLRIENVDLRLQVSALSSDKADLSSRMLQAAQRVNLLINKLPQPNSEKETS